MNLTEDNDVVLYYNDFMLIKIKDIYICLEHINNFNGDLKKNFAHKYFISIV